MELKARRINEKRVRQQKTSRGQQELKKEILKSIREKLLVWRGGRSRERGFEDNYSMKNPGDHCSGYKILNKTAGCQQNEFLFE